MVIITDLLLTNPSAAGDANEIIAAIASGLISFLISTLTPFENANYYAANNTFRAGCGMRIRKVTIA